MVCRREGNSADSSAARSRRFRHGAAQNARTRGHHLGDRGFFGNHASYQNWPKPTASGQHRIRSTIVFLGGNCGLRNLQRRLQRTSARPCQIGGRLGPTSTRRPGRHPGDGQGLGRVGRRTMRTIDFSTRDIAMVPSTLRVPPECLQSDRADQEFGRLVSVAARRPGFHHRHGGSKQAVATHPALPLTGANRWRAWPPG